MAVVEAEAAMVRSLREGIVVIVVEGFCVGLTLLRGGAGLFVFVVEHGGGGEEAERRRRSERRRRKREGVKKEEEREKEEVVEIKNSSTKREGREWKKGNL